MFVSLTVAALMMMADAAPAAAPAPKPQVQKVCRKTRVENSRIPKLVCWEESAKPAPTEVAQAGTTKPEE